MAKLKAILLSIVDITHVTNGGGLWTRNFLESVARIPETDFLVVSIGPEDKREASETFVTGLGMRHAFVPLRRFDTAPAHVPVIITRSRDFLRGKYFFSLEQEAFRQRHVNEAISALVERERPDLVILNYLFSALFARSVLASAIPYCVVTLNREATFHKLERSLAGPSGLSLPAKVARWLNRNFNTLVDARLASFERKVYAHAAGIVALTENDLPRGLSKDTVLAVLPPLFEPNETQWEHHGALSLFFVGNIKHYPNRLAIEWLSKELSPRLSKLEPRIRIHVIGAAPDDVPADWRRGNMDFMGLSNKTGVVRQMTTAGAFIAPISNDFGAKLKLTECVSFGMPFFATPAAMSGLPFLTGIPEIELDRPDAAARLVVDHLRDPDYLIALSHSIRTQAATVRTARSGAWQVFFRSCLARRQR